MSFNCLTCQVLQRTDSEKEYLPEIADKKFRHIKVVRNWSGNINPTNEHNGAVGIGVSVGTSSFKIPSRKAKTENHRRLCSTGAINFKINGEPKLVRSSGMRREWSFEDLKRRAAAKRIDEHRTS
ncbi:hypothetical protein K2173_016911 [Erythroxylum novogranatense]|uniref:HNH homing endonuclease n=1 Tax=Erythroxylum novogranatense TaxID=1862640 RepID=A0AAV8U947_9ROSI|nr:hypothetical protein K2173_016911 [Erythroxylum novogranatense]